MGVYIGSAEIVRCVKRCQIDSRKVFLIKFIILDVPDMNMENSEMQLDHAYDQPDLSLMMR